jgi:hypothetical protein
MPRRMPDHQVVPQEKRVASAIELSARVDRVARQLSRYGDATMNNLDADMVYIGLAHLLATWWTNLPDDEVKAQLESFVQRVMTGRRVLLEAQSKGATKQ